MDDREGNGAVAAAPSAMSAPRLRTLLICDLADSTALVERLGDAAAADLIRRHDRVARDLLHRHGGREIDKTDGFLALFERPVEAVAFALDYQRALRVLGDEARQPLRARVGIHVGEVVVWENSASDVASGAKTLDVEGLAKPVVARLMALASPGQILLSGVAFSLAQRAEGELRLPGVVRWLTHGRYRFKGVPAPMLVHEVGEAGVAPLQAPPSGPKAERDVPLWRKPGVIALEAFALIAAFAIPFALSLRAPPAIAFGERDWVVVGGLRNLTGDPGLEASLETAFRISLEQSRYVNVLPDLKLRDALARMQRPADTGIDREVASEIALREGARAVILPTVAEIGGRVRVSAEVIDPHTQTTVYAESADGVGAESALGSIDLVTHELRAKLGEALQAIENDSAPLPQVTSGNLEALRAYAQADAAYAASKLEEARASFEHAIAIDPDFALAHIGLARVEVRIDRLESGVEHARRAVELRDRLTARDALYVDAWIASFGKPAHAAGKWRLMATMYPDFHTASYNAALFQQTLLNEHAQCVEEIRPADVSQYLHRADAVYLLATCLAGSNRLPEALREFDRADALGVQGSGTFHSLALAASGQHALAEERLARLVAEDAPDADWDLELSRLAMSADRGDWHAHAQALAALERTDAARTPRGSRALDVHRAVHQWLTAAQPMPREATLAQIERYLESDSDAARRRGLYAAITLGLVSARAGAADLAQAIHERTRPLAAASGFPTHEALSRVLEARVQLARGTPDEALKVLAGGMSGSRPFQWDVAELEVQAALGQHQAALAIADRIVGERGRAYIDGAIEPLLRPLNVADLHLSRLRAAEVALAAGDPAAARLRLAQFSEAWNEERLPQMLRERVARITAAVTRAPSAPRQ